MTWRERYREFRDSTLGTGLLFLAFAILELGGAFVAGNGYILGMPERTLFVIGSGLFATAGVISLAPNLMKGVGKVLGVCLLLVGAIWLIVTGASAFGAVPVAIIIGALIIAAAIRSR